MCGVSSLYGDQVITGLMKSCKGWGKVLWEIQQDVNSSLLLGHGFNNSTSTNKHGDWKIFDEEFRWISFDSYPPTTM